MYANTLAGLYIRLSESDGDKRYEDDSESVANQRVILTDYVDKHNLTLVDEYVDDGYSGTNFNRPSFKRMIEDLVKGRINTVVVKDLSRFGRDHIDTGYFIENYFPNNNIRFISVMEKLDSANLDNYTDSVTFVMACNDFISKQNSLKIITALNNKKKAGKYIGSVPPFGYIRDPEDRGHLIPEPVNSDIVKKIFEMAYNGSYVDEIADYLNQNNVMTPSQRRNNRGHIADKWTVSSVRKIIENRMYTGDMVQSKSKKLSYKSDKKINIDKKDWIIVEDTHEPLVDKEIFYSVQSTRRRSKTTRSGRKRELLENLIYCRECCNGITLNCIGKKVTADCTTHSRYDKNSGKTCKSHYIIYKDFEELVINKLIDENVIDPNTELNRTEIQKIIDRIFIDQNKLITIVLKKHEPSILEIQYVGKRKPKE